MKKILGVLEGCFGSITPAEAAQNMTSTLQLLRSLTHGNITIEEAETFEDARRKLAYYVSGDTVIFNSCSMIEAARAIKKQFPYIKVVVITSAIPLKEIIIVDRSWLSDGNNTELILLNTRQ